MTNQRFPPTLGAAFWDFAALGALLAGFDVAGADEGFLLVAFAVFLTSFAALEWERSC